MKRFLTSKSKIQRRARGKATDAAPKERLLTPAHLVDTATIFAPAWRHLSPCVGAALQQTPLKSNLLKLGKYLTSSAKELGASTGSVIPIPPMMPGLLAKTLYFEPHPGAPIQPTRNKSNAAAHLTPPILGTLLGLALRRAPQKESREFLREKHGIKSNFVGDEWTGVSLARWEELQKSLGLVEDEKPTSYHIFNTLTQATWSMFLWEICHSKSCLLDAILHLEQASRIEILDSKNPLAMELKNSPTARAEWSNSCFTESIGYKDVDTVDAALQGILGALSKDASDFHLQQPSTEIGASFEIVCAHLATIGTLANKPQVPNGYYGYDGGEIKPDCVEVAVREFVDLLLWDETQGKFDLTRLPPSANPLIFDLYSDEDKSQLDKGKDWFHALSDISGCDYLSKSPGGSPYELTPTMRNLTKAMQHLLQGSVPSEQEKSQQEEWTTLKDLEAFWKASKLQISLGSLTYRARMSESIHVYEVATVALEAQAATALEFRLRCDWSRNTGFATVTHLRRAKNRLGPLTEQAFKRIQDRSLSLHDVERSSMLDILFLLVSGVSNFPELSHPRSSSNSMEGLWLEVLAHRFGLDRRLLMEIVATVDLEREDKAFRKAQLESERVQSKMMQKICQSSQMENKPDILCPLLGWIMTESPNVHPIENYGIRVNEDVEDALLALPLSILQSDEMQLNLHHCPFVRSSVVLHWIDWRAGNTSLPRMLRRSSLRDIPALLRKAASAAARSFSQPA